MSGRFTYMQELRVPGMLHGRVIRPPSIGAKLESVDESSVKNIPGLVQVVREGNFLGVVAQTEWAAIKARAIKATWSKWEGLPEQAKLFDMCARPRWSRTRSQATSATPPRRGARTARNVAATYDFAIHTHGSIGPSCAVAEFQDGKLTVVDQVSPWLTPRSTFAKSTQLHVGAHMRRNGTGVATSHPATRTACARPRPRAGRRGSS